SSGSPARAWAVTKVSLRASPRRVSDRPRLAAAALAAVTPGQTCTGTPAALHAASSSVDRPKIDGSPPLSRTTRSPAIAASTISASIACWLFECRPERLPTETRRTCGGASASTPGPTSASWKITRAARISRSALRVSRSGSPGPAPTSHTVPGAMRFGSAMGRFLAIADQALDCRAARAAVGSRRQRLADRLDGHQALGRDRLDDRLQPDVEAGADDRPAVGQGRRRPSGEQLDRLRRLPCGEL